MNRKRGGDRACTDDPLQPATGLGGSGVDSAQLVQLDEPGVRDPDQRVAESRRWCQ